jgi:hypothetical protein
MDKNVKDYIKDMAILIEKLKPFIMLIFLIVAILGVSSLVKYTKLQPEIKENCGWEDEGVKCICERDAYYILKEHYADPNKQIELNLSNET